MCGPMTDHEFHDDRSPEQRDSWNKIFDMKCKRKGCGHTYDHHGCKTTEQCWECRCDGFVNPKIAPALKEHAEKYHKEVKEEKTP